MPKISAGGLSFNYRKEGSGLCVTLAHGHGENLQMFDGLTAKLKRNHTVMRYDQRGYGLTDKPLKPPYSTELWAEDLHQLLSTLGIEEAVVAGHSMAGRICAIFAARHPEMAKGLITLNTTWFGTNPKAADMFEKNALRVKTEGIKAALDYSPWIVTIGKRRAEIKDKVRRETLKNDPSAYALGLRAIAADFRDSAREEILKAVRCPTLVLIGDRDSAPLEGAIKMHRGIKDSRLAVIPNSGHLSLLDRPRITEAIIAGFLEELAQQRTFSLRP